MALTLGFPCAVHASDHLGQLFPPSAYPSPPRALRQPKIERLVSYPCLFPSGTREVLGLFNQEKYLMERQSWVWINVPG